MFVFSFNTLDTTSSQSVPHSVKGKPPPADAQIPRVHLPSSCCADSFHSVLVIWMKKGLYGSVTESTCPNESLPDSPVKSCGTVGWNVMPEKSVIAIVVVGCLAGCTVVRRGLLPKANCDKEKETNCADSHHSGVLQSKAMDEKHHIGLH